MASKPSEMLLRWCFCIEETLRMLEQVVSQAQLNVVMLYVKTEVGFSCAVKARYHLATPETELFPYRH